jgi:hypothetical protein
MDLLSIGPWIVVATAVPAFVVLIVAVVALRGSAPHERPEIIRALADLISATRRGLDPASRKSLRPRPRNRNSGDP